MKFPTNGSKFDENNFLTVFRFVVDDFLKNSSEKYECIFKKSFGDNLSDKDTFSELARAGLIEVKQSSRVEARIYYLRAFEIEKPLLLLLKYGKFPVEFEKVKSLIPKITDRTYKNLRRNPECVVSDELSEEFNRILDLVSSDKIKILKTQQLKSEVGYSDGDDAYFNLLQKILEYTKFNDNRLFNRGSISTTNQKKVEKITEYFDDNSENDTEFPEGDSIEKKHKSKERNPKLISEAKEVFKKKHGKLFCQVCGFDFSSTYGSLGEDYIEGHHTLPVSEMKEGNTSLVKDIALVCANCHRMLHRKRPWLGMDDLKKVLLEKEIKRLK